ncbi:tyrosine-type recombinase/integrase [Tenuibacillus multivorans]|uniref:Phage integrase family protein n=1 Tax=Tenuibacillus multivorans TaxID=237069 RepID=A0A1H0EBW6_9BACI|nr:tyrosine-type recombinase/integrase [Tenuibacillus multivorans]GEL78744.1 integrase [Tenuibacillus multivorans]SDN79773.1 Phage integrase family protein [Tenuibacillus multivorans]
MEFVDPIKNLNDIRTIKKILKQHSQRDLLFFVLGINTGLRISHLLTLKIEDVWDGKGIKDFIHVADTHTGEKKAFYLNTSVKKEIKTYLSMYDFDPANYLFKSKKDNNPITRQQAYRIINHAAKEAGVKGKIGTHTLRKTFAYHAYRKGIAISIISKILNHHSTSDTLHYIGIDKHEARLIKVDVNL